MPCKRTKALSAACPTSVRCGACTPVFAQVGSQTRGQNPSTGICASACGRKTTSWRSEVASAHLCWQAGHQSPEQTARCRCCRSGSSFRPTLLEHRAALPGSCDGKTIQAFQEDKTHIACFLAPCLSPASLANTCKPHALITFLSEGS